MVQRKAFFELVHLNWKSGNRSCIRGIGALLLLSMLLAGNIVLAESTIDVSNPTCETYSAGTSKFIWVSDYDTSSHIDLTYGGCNQEDKGESGNAFVYLGIGDICPALDCGSPDGCYNLGGAEIVAIVKVTGDSSAYPKIFGDGIGIGGRGGYCSGVNGSLTIEEVDTDYEFSWPHRGWGEAAVLPIEVPSVKNPGTASCSAGSCATAGAGGSHDYEISVKFYIKRTYEDDSCYTFLAEKTGSITVKNNDRVEFDPFAFSPPTGSGPDPEICWIDQISRVYDGDDPSQTEWEFSVTGCHYSGGETYTENFWLGVIDGTCIISIPFGTYGWTLVPKSDTFTRVKLPVFGDDVNWSPGYASNEGWTANYGTKKVTLSLGDLGDLYFNCESPASTDADETKFLLSGIEYDDGVGESELLWGVSYSYNSPALLEYIYSGENTDPNNPENSERYYKYIWSQDRSELDVEYYNTLSDPDNPARKWYVEFDSEGRTEIYSSGCSQGCGGGSGEFEKVEYYDTDTFGRSDIVKRKYNFDGDVTLKNDYQSFEYRDYKTIKAYDVSNSGFESPDVTDGQFSVGISEGWSASDDDPNYVAVYDPSDSQWSSRYDSGESIPGGQQVLTLGDGQVTGRIEQTLGGFVLPGTIYQLECNVGAYQSNGQSQATIELIACDPEDADNTTTLITINVDETNEPATQGVKLIEGKWVTEVGLWDSGFSPNLVGQELFISISGNLIDIDNVGLIYTSYSRFDTAPILLSQRAVDPNASGDPNVLIVSRQYDADTNEAIEYKWLDNSNARVSLYKFSNNSFTSVLSKTEYEELNENPSDPNGASYTTYYSYESNSKRNYVTSPSGKRRDVKVYDENHLVRAWFYDIDNDANSNETVYTYNDDGLTENYTDSRGGLTNYYYNEKLLIKQEEPLGRVAEYLYDGARRMTQEKRKIANGNWTYTNYNFSSAKSYLDSVVSDNGGSNQQTTTYNYNDFGQATREKRPDGTVSGKTYSLGGLVESEFVLADPNDIDETDPNLILVSQTRYYYDDDGRQEYILSVKHNGTFTYAEPNSPESPSGPLEWIVSKNEYDFLGRRTSVTNDFGGLNLKTKYEYNNQGEVVKTTLPNGRWTKPKRNGRGLLWKQVVGYGEGTGETIVSTTEFSYDANGNMTKKIAPNGVITIYKYDNFDRLIKTIRGVKQG